MKCLIIVLTCVFFTLAVWAQDTGAQGTQPPPQGQPGPMHHQMHPPGMQEHMQEMKAQVASMRTKVDQMKANLGKIKDPATKQQMQLDTDLWDAMVTHLENMQKMMAEHMIGGMHHGPHGSGGPPDTPQQPAPPQ